MDDCVFCQIVAGLIPSYKVYEDSHFLAFLNIKPLSLGHTLVIPKKHFRWVYDVDAFADYWLFAKKITPAIQSVTNADFISYLTMGSDVPHAHIHIIPRFLNDVHTNAINTQKVQSVSTEEMQNLSQKINHLI